VLPEIAGPSFDVFFVYAEERRSSKRIMVLRDFLRLKSIRKPPPECCPTRVQHAAKAEDNGVHAAPHELGPPLSKALPAASTETLPQPPMAGTRGREYSNRPPRGRCRCGSGIRWCSCGLSVNQPWCDESGGSNCAPIRFTCGGVGDVRDVRVQALREPAVLLRAKLPRRPARAKRGSQHWVSQWRAAGVSASKWR